MASEVERKHDYLVKIVVIGDNCLCKTRSYFTLTEETYSLDQHLVTIGVDFRVRRLVVDSKLVKVQIWYPTGGERFRTILPSYFRGAHGFVVVYDSAQPNTLKNLDDWLKLIEESAPPNTEKFFISGFCDNSQQRAVELHDVEEFATAQNIPVIELDHDHLEVLEESFQAMVRSIVEKLPPNDSSEEQSSRKKTCSLL